jgi:serine/threonine protein kinase
MMQDNIQLCVENSFLKFKLKNINPDLEDGYQNGRYFSFNISCKQGSNRKVVRQFQKSFNGQVTFSCDGKKISIKASEASRVLGIDKKKIMRSAKDQTLESLFKQALLLDQSLIEEDPILKEIYKTLNQPSLPFQGKFSLQTIANIKKIWLEAQKNKKITVKITENTKKTIPIPPDINSFANLYVKTEIENQEYLIGIEPVQSPQKIKVTKIFKLDEEIGVGGNGRINKITNLINHQLEVFKYAFNNKKNGPSEKGVNQILNEYKILKTLNPNGSVIGIQTPVELVKIYANASQLEVQIGHIGDLYDKDYLKEIDSLWKADNKGIRQKTISKQEMSIIFSDLYKIISAVAYLEKNNTSHLDIKLENILFKKIEFENIFIRVPHIADFGDAYVLPSEDEISKQPITSLKELAKKISGANRTYTPYFSSIFDKKSSQELASKVKVTKKDIQELIKIERKADPFSLACIMYEALTGQDVPGIEVEDKTYWASSFEIEFFTTIKQVMKDLKINQKLQNLLIEMFTPIYEKRPTAQEVLEKYEEIMKKEGFWKEIELDLTNQLKAQQTDGITGKSNEGVCIMEMG